MYHIVRFSATGNVYIMRETCKDSFTVIQILQDVWDALPVNWNFIGGIRSGDIVLSGETIEDIAPQAAMEAL